jgi:hypothetical protein
VYKLEKLQVLEDPDVARVIVSDAPLVLSASPTEYDLLCSLLKMISSKPNGDGLHMSIAVVSASLDCVICSDMHYTEFVASS